MCNLEWKKISAYFNPFSTTAINFVPLIRTKVRPAKRWRKTTNNQTVVHTLSHWNVYVVAKSLFQLHWFLVRYNFAPFQFASITISHYIQRYSKYRVAKAVAPNHSNWWMGKKRERTFAFNDLQLKLVFFCEFRLFICVCQTFFFFFYCCCRCWVVFELSSFHIRLEMAVCCVTHFHIDVIMIFLFQRILSIETQKYCS